MIRKAVVPVAGLGTRMLPLTRSVPKEMLPLGRKPAIHRVVDELAAAGIDRILFVTASHKQSIEEYFERGGWDRQSGGLHRERQGHDPAEGTAPPALDYAFVRQEVPAGMETPCGWARHSRDQTPSSWPGATPSSGRRLKAVSCGA